MPPHPGPENYNLITIELEAAGAKTNVALTQAKLQGEPKADDLKRKDEFARNWTTVLDGLNQCRLQVMGSMRSR